MFPSLTAQNKKTNKRSFSYSTLLYHDLFDFPLTREDLVRWQTPRVLSGKFQEVRQKSGYFYLKGREELVAKRKLREVISLKKILYAKKVSRFLSLIPTIQMVGVTGSLAMKNADYGSDIDLMIVAKKGTLWTTRLVTLLALKFKRLSTRRFGDKSQKDKLCLNLWLDESSLVWRKRNIFTAHEIAQVLPILEKDWTYEEFMRKNRWIKKYWPNGAMFFKSKTNQKSKKSLIDLLFRLAEPLSFMAQKLYMRRKITNETISKNRAAFHPVNLSKFVSSRFPQAS